MKDQLDRIIESLELKDGILIAKEKDSFSRVDDNSVYDAGNNSSLCRGVSSSAMRVLLKAITDNNSMIEIGEAVEDSYGLPMVEEMILRGKYMRAV